MGDSFALFGPTYAGAGTPAGIAGVTSDMILASALHMSGPAASGAAAVALTAAQSGGTFLMDAATGITYTLPAPVAGMLFTFIVSVAVTSNNHKVITKTIASQFVQGAVVLGLASSADVFPANGSSHVAITMNGTTTGGLLGTQVTFKALSATKWQVTGIVVGSGSIATPFTTS